MNGRITENSFRNFNIPDGWRSV